MTRRTLLMLCLVIAFAMFLYLPQVGENNASDVIEHDGMKRVQVDSPSMSPVRDYFKAVANNDIDAFMDVFSENAKLRVVSRELSKDQGIRRFAVNEVLGGSYEVYRALENENTIKILLQFTPLNWSNPEPMAVYEFTIDDGLITEANLQYATNEDKKAFSKMTLESTSLIPLSFAKFLDGVRQDDIGVFLEGFSDGAVVKDVNRLIEGKASIGNWGKREVLGLEYRVGKIVYQEDSVTLVNAISFGQGQPDFYAAYDLILQEGLIEYAELQYANESDYLFDSKIIQ